MQVVFDEGTLREARALEVASHELNGVVGAVALLYLLQSYEESGLDGMKAFNKRYGVVDSALSDDDLIEMAGKLTKEMKSFEQGLQDLQLAKKEALTLLHIHTRWFSNEDSDNTENQED